MAIVHNLLVQAGSADWPNCTIDKTKTGLKRGTFTVNSRCIACKDSEQIEMVDSSFVV